MAVIGLGAGDYEYLSGSRTSWTTVLCGRDAVQIVPPTEQELPLEDLKQRLARFGEVLYNGFLLSFQIGDRELVLFPREGPSVTVNWRAMRWASRTLTT